MPKILMLGTKAQGGMKTVVNSYLNSCINKDYPIFFIPTHIETNTILKIIYFISSIVKSSLYFLNPQYKIIHMHISKHGSIMRKNIFIKISKILKKKIILHTHGAEFFSYYNQLKKNQKIKLSNILNKSDAFIVLSEKRKKEYAKIIAKDKIHIIPNFISIPKTLEKKSKQLINIITLGRLGNRKGTYDLINALNIIKQLNFEANLAGDGDLNTYQKYIDNFKLTKQIKLLGWISGDNKKELLEKADIFVLPSYFEDMPMAILEAMAYGIPIISTNIAGIPEVVENNANGFLIKPGDINNLANKLKTLIINKSLRCQMGKRSLKIIREKFEQSLIEKRILIIYKNLLKI